MRLFVLCSLIVMGGCAANPGPSPGSDAAAASPQAAASAPAAAPSPAAQPAAKASNVPFDLPPGFKPTRISGELFYCRKMVVLGSRFPKQLCLNEDQLKEHIARNEAMKRNKDEVSRLCTTKEGCAWD
jgi:hypothetical protein